MGLLIRKKIIKIVDTKIEDNLLNDKLETIEDSEVDLEIKEIIDNDIRILGTDIILDSVYLRFEFNCNIDGRSVDIKTETYFSKNVFKENKIPILTTVPNRILNIKLKDIDSQNVDTIKLYLKDIYEKDGWQIEII